MIFLQANWIVGHVCAYVYFVGGQFDARHGNRRNHGPWWDLASILVTVAVIQLMNAGWLLVPFSQPLLLVGRGTPSLSVVVVPDSGTEELAGLEGEFKIIIEGGRHSYEFNYRLLSKD